MKYMGSKARFAKEILPIILKGRQPNQWYVEPFAGGMNAICEVDGNRIANDLNTHLIEMWKGLTSGVKYPLEIPKDLYNPFDLLCNIHILINAKYFNPVNDYKITTYRANLQVLCVLDYGR